MAEYSAGDGVIAANGTIGAGNVAAALSNPIYAAAANFLQSAPQIQNALSAVGAPVTVIPGIEIQSSLQSGANGNLTLGAAWDLSQWNFGGSPGVLTLRAAGNLTFQKSLSDGFQGATGFTLLSQPSWSYRLVAGANLQSADAFSLIAPADLPSGSGTLSIAPGLADGGGARPRVPQPIMIRTGTGDIDIAAAGNLSFGNQASVIYTAGRNSGLGIPLIALSNLAYPIDGGNIDIHAQQDIIGAPTNQLVTSWLWRSGLQSATGGAATGWTDNYQWFEENIGALAGGNVRISAGGDIQDLSVAVASIGRQIGGTTSPQNQLMVTGGGQLSVESSGDITGGSYFVGAGAGTVTAWGRIGAATSSASSLLPLSPVIALGDAQISVQARTELQLESILNPFLLPVSNAQGVARANAFSTYTDASAINLYSNGGDVRVLNQATQVGGLQQQLSSMIFTDSSLSDAFALLPGTLTVQAPAGSISVVGDELALWPSRTGNLELFAVGSVDFSASGGLLMSDVDPASLPTVAAPVKSLGLLRGVLFDPPLAGTPHTPIHSALTPGSSTDLNPVRIVSLTGDVTDANLLYIPKPIDIIAGRDILDLSLDVEQFDPTNVSVISAGRNLDYSFPRNSLNGELLPESGPGLEVEGPGQLLVQAGGNVNLGTSPGITSEGNLANPSLPSGGAGISVIAGATASRADLTDFIQTYLVAGTSYDDLLLGFVQQATGTAPTSKAAALTALSGLSPEEQFLLSEQILIDELRAGGRSAAGPGSTHDDYTRAFTALDTLFPNATDATMAGTLYPGSISLFFSRIYTLNGGDISLIAPGGNIDVGLASPPAAFGLSKQPSDLGIVAEGSGNISALVSGNFAVNESRVFAADGGNILVWSTNGDIDAGRGAKTAISAPPPTVTLDANGHLVTVFPAALQGSGIQALATTAGVGPGDVDLFAPHGVVNAGDAGIVAGNLT
ncbi:MAG TPA: filamentous hemagglutinin family protein, partial [Steroidobacteraceae bacterium]|nr:filamentous hemagglutinin family protein [Steroidobacteraceae bacterium]